MTSKNHNKQEGNEMNMINLDHISANPLLPEVQEAMIKAIQGNYGNPSSQHKMGEQASEAIEQARESLIDSRSGPHP